MPIVRFGLLSIFALIWCVGGALPLAGQGPAYAQQPAAEISYFYDELGRLIAVVDPSSDTVTYSYDAVGNLVAISRELSTPVSIIEFTPNSGAVGATVIIRGIGFSATATDNVVAFNGVAATVLSATSTELQAVVPEGASSGAITVSNSNGTATSREPFTVTTIGITIAPPSAVVIAGNSKQFTANVTGLTNADVIWEMEGVGTTVGSLSSSGLYSVPSGFADTALVIVKATSVADPTQSATALVSVIPSATHGPISGQTVSVQVAPVSGAMSGPFTGPAVSVRLAPASSATSSGPFVGPAVSVGMGAAVSGPFVGSPVSVSLTPTIQTISPGSGSPGEANLPVVLTGAGLAGATSLTFILDGVVDSTVVAGNVVANAEGTQVTADLAVAASASIGRRVVRVTTPNGTSPAAMMGGNTFNVTNP